MAQDHTLMASRFELKYIIPERVALQVRAFIQQHLEVDEFGNIKNWPPNFFGDSMGDLMEMQRAAAERRTKDPQAKSSKI